MFVSLLSPCSFRSIDAYAMKSSKRNLNNGVPFQAARFVEKASGAMKECILDATKSDANVLTYWETGSYVQTSISTSKLQIMNPSLAGLNMYLITLNLVEDLPKEGTFYKEVAQSTGGVGRHPRMEIQFPCGDMDSQTILLVSIAHGTEQALEKLLLSSDALIQNVPSRSYFNIPGKNTIGTMVTVKKRANMVTIISIFAWHGFTACVLEKEDFKIVGYMPDKLSRAQTMWVRQFEKDPASVGPVRDGYRYRPHSFKEGWQSVYSFQGYGREIAKELMGKTTSEFPDIDYILEKLKGITFPMRTYVIEQIHLLIDSARLQLSESLLLMQREQTQKAVSGESSDTTWTGKIHELLQRLTEVAVILNALQMNKEVAPLTWAQMQQVNQVTYAADYAPYSDEHKKRLQHVCLLYAIHGTVGRIAGNYEKSGKFRGLSDDLRVFHGETSEQLQTAYENGDTSVLPATAINRLQKNDGKLKGTGGRGYKGIHMDKRKPEKVYTPKWIMKRTVKVDDEARSVKTVRL